MIKFLPLVLLFLLNHQALAIDTSTSIKPPEIITAQSNSSIDEVLVVGEQPGPELWKVSKDDHVLWVLGTFSPLPKGVKWHPKQVEHILAGSQEVLMPPGLKIQSSFLGSLTILPLLIGIENIPDGETLRDILPAELFEKWTTLKEKYIGKDKDVDKKRPIFAAKLLLKKAEEKAGLSFVDFNQKIESMAKKYKVKVVWAQVTEKMENPRQSVKKFKNSKMDDVGCFDRVLSRVEADISITRNQANAWAVGNLDLMRQLSNADDKTSCLNAILSSSINEGNVVQNLLEQSENKWLQAAETALSNNSSTLAVVPIAELLRPNNYLTKLRAKGYLIEGYGYINK